MYLLELISVVPSRSPDRPNPAASPVKAGNTIIKTKKKLSGFATLAPRLTVSGGDSPLPAKNNTQRSEQQSHNHIEKFHSQVGTPCKKNDRIRRTIVGILIHLLSGITKSQLSATQLNQWIKCFCKCNNIESHTDSLGQIECKSD